MSQPKTMPANMKELEILLDEYLVKKAPALPANIKEIIVKFGPWVVLVLMLLAIPAMLAALGLSAVFMPVAAMGGYRMGLLTIISLVLGIAVLVLELMALPGLFKRQRQGWRFMYYATLVGAVSSAISLNIVSLIVGTLLSLYILFQIKSYYK